MGFNRTLANLGQPLSDDRLLFAALPANSRALCASLTPQASLSFFNLGHATTEDLDDTIPIIMRLETDLKSLENSLEIIMQNPEHPRIKILHTGF